MPTIADLDTPCVLIDLDRVEHNLQRAQEYADAHGLPLRPHIKTHKLPRFAREQVRLGAIGITCQKLGEAEVMADASLTDIFIPYNILGAAKLARLKALNGRITLAVGADSDDTVAGYAAAFARSARPLNVLIECDTGMGRCGLAEADAVVTLARAIAVAPGLVFKGIFTYPAAGRQAEAHDWLKDCAARLTAANLAPEVISSGGTPDLWSAASGTASGVTEYRPGTYIYLDRSQVARGVGGLEDCALTVLATVVSRPTPDRCVLDAGSKALTSDTLGMAGFGLIREYPQAVIASLSEEHGVVDLSGCGPERPAIGERVTIIPNHACVVGNLFDEVHLVRGSQVVETTAVAARGRVD